MLKLLRRSVQARAVATTVALSGVLIAALGGFLSFSIGNGLFEARLSQILAESEAAVIDVQIPCNAPCARQLVPPLPAAADIQGTQLSFPWCVDHS